MKRLLIFICCVTLLSCGHKSRIDVTPSDTIEENTSGETLNDIRFAGWDKNEWADNEYIQTLRNYLDAYNSGTVQDARLDEYKDYIKGKLVIAEIQPYIAGGAYISIIFYDKPDMIFSAVVYSVLISRQEKSITTNLGLWI